MFQKPGAFQRKQTCPTEECSKNLVQFLEVLFGLTHSMVR